MPIAFSVDHEKQVVSTIASGPITFDEIREHVHRERDQGGIAYREFIDATQASAAFTSAQARTVVEIVRSLARKGDFGPTAVLVANDVTYGMIRMLQILLEDVADIGVYRAHERQAAETWVLNYPRGPGR